MFLGINRMKSSSLWFGAVFPTDRRYFTDGRHLNEDGAQLKAKLIGAFLLLCIAVPIGIVFAQVPKMRQGIFLRPLDEKVG